MEPSFATLRAPPQQYPPCGPQQRLGLAHLPTGAPTRRVQPPELVRAPKHAQASRRVPRAHRAASTPVKPTPSTAVQIPPSTCVAAMSTSAATHASIVPSAQTRSLQIVRDNGHVTVPKLAERCACEGRRDDDPQRRVDHGVAGRRGRAGVPTVTC